ncbi:hypothetical protein CBM2605_B150041 [Cupriavidus neocaledonicus]|uniref:Uncharacterized protein n=1 Tax=Cupriavidus neocaledonicus TaxID=1040979 RepID=A0ABY1VCB4_9BURK|nr:hypothetical protein CBM2605_B150041 [Cupriavidus neocaledonicus]
MRANRSCRRPRLRRLQRIAKSACLHGFFALCKDGEVARRDGGEAKGDSVHFGKAP